MILNTLKERDAALEELWDDFADVLFDEDEDGRLILSEPWHDFPAGTEREEIWHWFDERHSKGVIYLLYNDGVDRTPMQAKLMYLHELCKNCGSEDCVFNDDGVCKYAMVHGEPPVITDEEGCTAYTLDEGACQ